MNVKLGSLAKIETGVVVSRYKRKNESELAFPYTVISLRSFEDFPYYDHQYVEEFIANKEISNDKYFPKKGDVVIRLRKPFHAVIIEHDYDNFVCNAVTAIITVNSDDILPKYLAYVLNTSIVYEQLENNISGSQHQLINTTDLRNLEIPLINLDFQEKIVDYIQNLYEEKMILESLMQQKQDYTNKLIEKVISIGTNK